VQAVVRQAQVVLSGMVGELNSDIRRRLLASPGSKVALFSRPEQVWTDIPEHSIWKGTEFGAHDLAGKWQQRSSTATAVAGQRAAPAFHSRAAASSGHV
jgi:hypothetical protein